MLKYVAKEKDADTRKVKAFKASAIGFKDSNKEKESLLVFGLTRNQDQQSKDLD